MTDTKEMKSPGHYAKNGGTYDLTGHIGPLWPIDNKPKWPMYSFDRPSHILWNALGAELFANGWTDDEIKSWLQSKGPRYELDGGLAAIIEEIGKLLARKVMTDYP